MRLNALVLSFKVHSGTISVGCDVTYLGSVLKLDCRLDVLAPHSHLKSKSVSWTTEAQTETETTCCQLLDKTECVFAWAGPMDNVFVHYQWLTVVHTVI